MPPGVPPWDLLEEIGQQLRQQNYDVDDVFQRAASVSNEWTYDPCRGGGGRLRDRFQPKFNRERTMALKWRTLAETLNPQPCAPRKLQEVIRPPVTRHHPISPSMTGVCLC